MRPSYLAVPVRCLGVLFLAQCLVGLWIHVLLHPGWLLADFCVFLRDWLTRLLRSILLR